MSDATEAPAADAAAAPAKPAGAKSGLLPIVLGVVNLGATGVVVFKLLTAQPATASAHEAAPPPPPPDAQIVGPVVTMEPFVINLADEGASRYLKLGFDLELGNGKAKDELEKAMRVVRDEIFRYLSGLSVSDTLGEAAKHKIQDEIVGRIEKLLGRERVRRLFFTEFVVQ